MSGSVLLDTVEYGDTKIYYLGYEGTEAESVKVNKAKEADWSKSRLILM